MTNPEGDLPDGVALADFLGKFLNEGGDFKKLFSSPPTELDSCKEGFFSRIDFSRARMSDKRAAAVQIRIQFAAWRAGMIISSDLSMESQKQLQGLTLNDMADYAGMQFEKWKKEAAIAVPGSREAENARLLSDYWSIMDEVIKPAADPD